MAAMQDGPLAGLRVIDLTRILAGPFCTMMLGDLGADVIKVEAPDGGDDTRGWGPPFVAGEAAYFLGLNRNKRSMTLNLAAEPGQTVLARLIARSDVLVENFKHGTLAKWGFTDAWFDRHAPRLVRCSITGYAARGTRASQPGYDFILQAESGLMSICGDPDGAPMKYGVAIVDLCTGMLACNAVLGALVARRNTGRGQAVAVSLHQTSLAMLANVGASYLAAGAPGRRLGNEHPSIVPYTAYPTADGMIAVAVGNDAQFGRCAAALGHPEWSDDPRFARNRDRVENRDEINGLMAAVLTGNRTQAWLEQLRAAGIPCGIVKSVAEALDDPEAAACGMVETVEHPLIGSLRMLGIPFDFSDTPARVRRPPPSFGQHTDEILAGELGMDDAAISALRREEVIR